MALVDYDSSGESGDEESKKEDGPPGRIADGNSVGEDVRRGETADGDKSLFSSLPRPRDKTTLCGDEDKLKDLLLNKGDGSSKKEHVKITIPSLSEFEKDDDAKPVPKRHKPSSPRDTGLFSILPPPKNAATKEMNRKLIPQVVSNMMSKPKPEVKAAANKAESSGSGATNGNEEDDDYDVSTTSYFGDAISEQHIRPPGVCDSEFIVPPGLEGEFFPVPLPPLPRPETVNAHDVNVESDAVPGGEVVEQKDVPPEKNNGILELDEKALQILCGGKRKRTNIPMNIIELSGEEIMPDSKEWLLKQLSQERKVKSHSHRKHDGPSVQQRRKHQITYLAFQAKEQELELQNQWAQNRMSRKQTQSKYGF